MKCKRCVSRTAQTPQDSRFQLCLTCAGIVCPGPDVAAYQRLYVLYGYNNTLTR